MPSPHQKSQHRDRQTPPILYKFSTQICHHQVRKCLRLRPKFHHITTSPIKFHQTNTNPPSRHEFHHLSPQNTIFTLANCASNTHRATGELQTFLAIAFLTGARAGEILALHKSDIDFHNATIIIDKNQTRYELTTPKNGRPRTIHAPRELIAHLKKCKFIRRQDFHQRLFSNLLCIPKATKMTKIRALRTTYYAPLIRDFTYAKRHLATIYRTKFRAL